MANTDSMTTQQTLVAYSEWLDSEGLIVSDRGNVTGQNDEPPVEDKRTHDDLAREFIAYWKSNENRAALAGRP